MKRHGFIPDSNSEDAKAAFDLIKTEVTTRNPGSGRHLHERVSAEKG